MYNIYTYEKQKKNLEQNINNQKAKEKYEKKKKQLNNQLLTNYEKRIKEFIYDVY